VISKVARWGNSQGLRIRKEILAEIGLEVDDPVEISVREGAIVITPTRRPRERYRLEDLVAQMPEDYMPQEEDWGLPVGRESW